jgi:hypothetical protein
MRPLDIQGAAAAWVLNVITLGGIGSYYTVFSAAPDSHVPFLRADSDVMSFSNASGSWTLLPNAAIDFAYTFSAVTMVAGVPGVVIMYLMYTERIQPKVHLHLYRVLQGVFSCVTVLTTFAFLLQHPCAPRHV